MKAVYILIHIALELVGGLLYTSLYALIWVGGCYKLGEVFG
jgi:hypothetical protein